MPASLLHFCWYVPDLHLFSQFEFHSPNHSSGIAHPFQFHLGSCQQLQPGGEIRGLWNILENLGGTQTFLKVHSGRAAKTFPIILPQICVSILWHGVQLGSAAKMFHMFKRGLQQLSSHLRRAVIFYHHRTFQPTLLSPLQFNDSSIIYTIPLLFKSIVPVLYFTSYCISPQCHIPSPQPFYST